MYDALMEVLVNIRDSKSEETIERLLEHNWPFTIKVIKQSHSHDALITISEGELYLEAGNGQRPILFSWDEKMSKWSKDRNICHNLRKSLGVQTNDFVIDATVGFGQDTSYLLYMGLNVIGFERVPFLYFLHKSALILSDKVIKLELIFGQASDSDYRNIPIYFDPMFDDGSKRRAQAKKSMSFLHKVIGIDKDAVVEAKKLRFMSSRLVIKKSPRDPHLIENCNSSWKSKAVRFDLYL